jgi:hypothetical protein
LLFQDVFPHVSEVLPALHVSLLLLVLFDLVVVPDHLGHHLFLAVDVPDQPPLLEDVLVVQLSDLQIPLNKNSFLR